MKTWPELFKRTTKGEVQGWKISVQDNKDGTATIIVDHGLVDGKRQIKKDVVREGKNAGKKNATTALQQAINEAQSKWDLHKDRKHYGLTVDESAEKRGAAPMLAHPIDKHLKSIQWNSAFAQRKFDGFRCLASYENGVLTLRSREGGAFTVPHIVAELEHYLEEGVVADGELYCHGMKFEKIASAIKKQSELRTQLKYIVYDQVSDLPFEERFREVEAMFSGASHILTAETVRVTDQTALDTFEEICITEKYEGAILRHGRGAYEAGKRSKFLLKVKRFSDAEFLITGVTQGRGTHAGMAIFQCVTVEGHPFDVLSHGSHEEKREHWKNRDKCIGRQLTVKCQEFTKTDKPVPRCPIALRFHETIHG